MSDERDLGEPEGVDVLGGDALEGDARVGVARERDVPVAEGPASERPSDPGGEVLALRFMVKAIEAEPAPVLDWQRVEASLFARIEAEQTHLAEPTEPSTVSPRDLPEPPIAAGGSARVRALAAQASRAESGGSGESHEAAAASSAGEVTHAPAASQKRASLLVLGERGRVRRGSSKLRARSLGLWAAAATLLVSAAAFAWFERAGARPEPRREGEAGSELPALGSSAEASAVGTPGSGAQRSASTEAPSLAEGRAQVDRGSEPRRGASHAGVDAGSRRVATQASPFVPSGIVSSPAALEPGAQPGSGRSARPADGLATSSRVEATETTSDAELAARVRRCLVERAPHPSNLDEGLDRRIESSLRVRVEPNGQVAAVSFHPPLRPELQSCALFVLSLRLAEGPRELSVPIRLD